MFAIETILFDLDGTLLGNNMDQFMPAYFAILGEYARPVLPKDRFLKELLAATQAMIKNDEPLVSNHQAFWAHFGAATGLDPQTVEPFFDDFYHFHFAQLQRVTETRPVVRPLIEHCFAQGWQVVIATNPLFPRPAIEQRLAWAGVPVTEYPYALVTSYENMHSTKPHPAYYREILQRVGAKAETTLMVGDDWNNDIVPAGAIGLQTYWITATAPHPTTPSGTLEDFYRQLGPGA